jgi:hypothetical protein
MAHSIEICGVMNVCYRFHLVPSFGKDNIHRFSNNASQMKSLAATNFEDLLQVFPHGAKYCI